MTLQIKRSILSEDIDEILNRKIPWESLSGTKIVITGAGGFLGGYLVRTLLALNERKLVQSPIKVIGLVRNIERARYVFNDILIDSNFTLYEWDLNVFDIPKIDNVHYILHAASQASPRFYGVDPVGTLLTNSIGTAALLTLLQKSNNPRGFLFVSSSEVYGSVQSDLPLEENFFGTNDPAVVRSCYAEGKRVGETTCVSWFHQYKLPTFIVRPFHTYGPGLQPTDGRVFADFVFNIVRGENIVMNSDGLTKRAFCYVSDAISGFFTVLLKGEAGKAYNVANPKGELSILELGELLVSLFPEKNLIVERRINNTGSYLTSQFNRLLPDISKLSALGWKPEIMPRDGFYRMIQNYINDK